jgi:hypothetical protein
LAPSARFLQGARVFQYAHDQNTRAEESEEFTPVDVEVIRRRRREFKPIRFQTAFEIKLLAHCFDSFMTFAALCIASTMRGWVPQRQMLPSIERAISAADESRLAFNSETAVMIIPEVQ